MKKLKDGLPSPEDVLALAILQLPRISVHPYQKAILCLRGKGYSYRQMSKWFLVRHGLVFSTSQMWRVCNQIRDTGKKDWNV